MRSKANYKWSGSHNLYDFDASISETGTLSEPSTLLRWLVETRLLLLFYLYGFLLIDLKAIWLLTSLLF